MSNWKKGLATLLSLILVLSIVYLISDKVDLGPFGSVKFEPSDDSESLSSIEINAKPKNIIIFIADGMGFSHLSLAEHTQKDGPWNSFTVKGWHDPRSNYGPLTDSGASATAMATGTSTYFEIIGMDPDGNILKNVFEVAQDSGYASGIVTDSYIWDATPAAFVAHTLSRDNSVDILNQIASSKLDLIFGELEDVGEKGNPDNKTTLRILEERFQLLDESLNLPKADSILTPVAAVFQEDQVQDMESNPNLVQLTRSALKYLASNDKPFILLVESEEMDAASHDNNTPRILRGLESIKQTVSLLVDYSMKDGETLLVFTADHETGGLSVVSDSGVYPDMRVQWSTQEHTTAVVPILAAGPGAELFSNISRNYEIGIQLRKLIASR